MIPYVVCTGRFSPSQDMEKHGRLLHCVTEIRQMLQTPIKPYTKPEAGEEKEGGEKSGRSLRRREGRREGKSALKEDKTDAACSGDEDGECVCVCNVHIACMYWVQRTKCYVVLAWHLNGKVSLLCTSAFQVGFTIELPCLAFHCTLIIRDGHW